MDDDPNCIFTTAQELAEIVAFAGEDGDHVLRRRFEKLHLYNLYSKHQTLVKLDEKLGELEAAVRSASDKDHELSPKTIEKASELRSLVVEVDKALEAFGTPLYPV